MNTSKERHSSMFCFNINWQMKGRIILEMITFASSLFIGPKYHGYFSSKTSWYSFLNKYLLAYPATFFWQQVPLTSWNLQYFPVDRLFKFSGPLKLWYSETGKKATFQLNNDYYYILFSNKRFLVQIEDKKNLKIF